MLGNRIAAHLEFKIFWGAPSRHPAADFAPAARSAPACGRMLLPRPPYSEILAPPLTTVFFVKQALQISHFLQILTRNLSFYIHCRRKSCTSFKRMPDW